MSVNELFNKANKLFSDQKYIEGLEIYKQVLFKYPKNIRLSEEVNKKIKKYKKLISETYKQSQIDNFFQLEKVGKATIVIQDLQKNLKKNPNDILTISLLGIFYNSTSDYEKAVYFQKLAIKKAPLEGALYLNLSQTLEKNWELEGALKILFMAKILSLKDKSIDYRIAKLHTKMKNFAKADLIYKDLTKEKNFHDEIIYSYCENLIKNKKEKEVIKFIEVYQKSHDINYKHKLILGLAYLKQKDVDKAVFYLLESLDLKKDNVDALNLLGNCYEFSGDLNRAKTYYEEVLSIDPYHKHTLNNLAALYFFNDNIEMAEKYYDISIKKVQNNGDAKYYLAQCQLAQNNFVNGWFNYKNRWAANEFNSVKLITGLEKFYLGTDKKNLLVWSEQGIGDQILFLRFLKNLEPYVDNLFIKIDERLREIVKSIYPKINFFNVNKNATEIIPNSQIPICDLGSLFIKNISDLENNSDKYLIPDTILTKNLKNTLKIKTKLICGLSWVSKNDDIGFNKSITLEILKPILILQDIVFIDLQYNDTKEERSNILNKYGVEIKKFDTIDNFNDLNGITSLINLCDIIITVSNTNAHIAGALGKETYLLLPKGKGRLWYWSTKKNKSLWYKSIMILQQKILGKWDNPIQTLRELLRRKVNE